MIGFSFSSPNSAYLITELVSGPDLDTLIFSAKYKETFVKLSHNAMALDMARAICYLHGQAKPILHRDVKPGNFVVELYDGDPPKCVVKLIDLGIGRIRSMATTKMADQGFYVGTLSYMAPEMLLASVQGSLGCDIWSLGCVFAELFTRKAIWRIKPRKKGGRVPSEEKQLISLMRGENVPHAVMDLIHKSHSHVSLIVDCVNYDIDSRPTADHIVDTLLKYQPL